MATDSEVPPRKNQLRIAVILCCSFARNLAYYRAWWGDEHQHFLALARPHEHFWTAVNNNFFDMCVLEWCKLFGGRLEKHRWQAIVSDPVAFKEGLLRHLGMDADAHEQQVETMRFYRDTGVAHRDLIYSHTLPTLDVAKQAAWFYHGHIVNREAKPGDLFGLPLDINTGYEEEVEMAKAVYRANQ
jgi:hypothetical protein